MVYLDIAYPTDLMANECSTEEIGNQLGEEQSPNFNYPVLFQLCWSLMPFPQKKKISEEIILKVGVVSTPLEVDGRVDITTTEKATRTIDKFLYFLKKTCIHDKRLSIGEYIWLGKGNNLFMPRVKAAFLVEASYNFQTPLRLFIHRVHWFICRLLGCYQ